jgi:Yip1-like protein
MESSSFGRLIGVLVAPVRTFQSIAQRPTWLVALLVLVALGTTVGVLAFQKVDIEAAVRAQIEERSGGDASAEQVERATEVMGKFGWVIALFGGLVFAPLAYLAVALVFWVVFKLLGSDLAFPASFSVTLHGLMPGAVGALLAIPVVIGAEEIDLQDLQSGNLLLTNLGALAPEGSGAALRSLLSSLDLFSLWSLVLLAVGYAIVGRVSRATAAWTVTALWILYVLCKAGWAAAFS